MLTCLLAITSLVIVGSLVGSIIPSGICEVATFVLILFVIWGYFSDKSTKRKAKLAKEEQIRLENEKKALLSTILSSMSAKEKRELAISDTRPNEIRIGPNGFVLEKCVRIILIDPEKLNWSPERLSQNETFGSRSQWSDAKYRINEVISEKLDDDEVLLRILEQQKFM